MSNTDSEVAWMFIFMSIAVISKSLSLYRILSSSITLSKPQTNTSYESLKNKCEKNPSVKM